MEKFLKEIVPGKTKVPCGIGSMRKDAGAAQLCSIHPSPPLPLFAPLLLTMPAPSMTGAVWTATAISRWSLPISFSATHLNVPRCCSPTDSSSSPPFLSICAGTNCSSFRNQRMFGFGSPSALHGSTMESPLTRLNALWSNAIVGGRWTWEGGKEEMERKIENPGSAKDKKRTNERTDHDHRGAVHFARLVDRRASVFAGMDRLDAGNVQGVVWLQREQRGHSLALLGNGQIWRTRTLNSGVFRFSGAAFKVHKTFGWDWPSGTRTGQGISK